MGSFLPPPKSPFKKALFLRLKIGGLEIGPFTGNWGPLKIPFKTIFQI